MTDELRQYLYDRGIGEYVFTYEYTILGIVSTINIQQIKITGDPTKSLRSAEENTARKALIILNSTPGIRFRKSK